jgi:D-amino-acid oxidase
MTRREFLHSSAAVTSASMLTGCTPKHVAAGSPLPVYDAVPPLQLIRADPDRLFRTTVCLRPFRAVGPRIEAETANLGGKQKLVIHNYGHGGSGWSLSWGSATVAMELARQTSGMDLSGQQVAMIGSGALGLTLATLLQRNGAQVTIYARDRPADSRSFRATGSWTPDSRIALSRTMAPKFPALWERMTRASWSMYQGYLGLAGAPVEFTDRFILSDLPPEEAHQKRLADDAIGFAHLQDSVLDLTPRSLDLPPGTHPFPTRYARRNTQLMFNVTDLVHQLTEDILIAGGRIETREFHTPADLGGLPQKIIFNCTGYGARALFTDDTVIPVRGQIGWLIPQSGCDYGLVKDNLNILCRPDGIVVQLSQQGEATGWQSVDETLDRAEAEEGVRQLQAIMRTTTPTAKA